VAEASVRTTAGNAAVFGLGPTRRVVLDDTVLNGRFTRPEIEVLAAHELGHVAEHHVWKWTALFALFALPGLAVVALAAEAHGGPARPEAVPGALLAAVLFSLAAMPLANAFSRRYEAEADWVALRATREPRAMIDLQRRLALSSLVDPTPPEWSRLFLSTHPSPLERIALAKASERLVTASATLVPAAAGEDQDERNEEGREQGQSDHEEPHNERLPGAVDPQTPSRPPAGSRGDSGSPRSSATSSTSPAWPRAVRS
jgi:predicted Zn-dependent protease